MIYLNYCLLPSAFKGFQKINAVNMIHLKIVISDNVHFPCSMVSRPKWCWKLHAYMQSVSTFNSPSLMNNLHIDQMVDRCSQSSDGMSPIKDIRGYLKHAVCKAVELHLLFWMRTITLFVTSLMRPILWLNKLFSFIVT